MSIVGRQLASLEDTAKLAREVAAALAPGDSVALIGGLGAGKTTFSRELVRALGGVDEVSSPTYVLEHEYIIPKRFVVRHWDVYRLGAVPPELLEPTSIDEVRLVEWADKFPEILDTAELTISFAVIGGSAGELRTASISGPAVSRFKRDL